MLELVVIGYLITYKYFISPDCSFKVSERPTKFTVNVSVVWVMSGSTTTPTWSLRSHRLCLTKIYKKSGLKSRLNNI